MGSIALGCIAWMALLWIASRLRLHRSELHRRELSCLGWHLRCFELHLGLQGCGLRRFRIAMLWMVLLWTAMLGLHYSGLHLDWDCITRNCIALTCMLRIHLFVAVALVCIGVAECLQKFGKAIIGESYLQPQHWRRTRYGGWPCRPVCFWREIRVGCAG